MRTTVGSSRRVGVCAARKRATPTRIERRLLGAFGPRGRLAHAGLDASGTSGTRRPRRAAPGRARRSSSARVPPACRKPYASLPASSTMPCTSKQRFERVEAAARRLREPRRGHVEEAVEVDAQRGVHRAAQQLGRRVAAQRLVQRVRGGERVVHGVPVAVVVLHVEARDAQRGRVRDRRGRAPRRSAPARSASSERVGDGFGIVVEQLPAERADVGELAACGRPSAACSAAPRSSLPRARRGRAGGATRRTPRSVARAVVWRTSVGSTSAAASSPRMLDASNALFVKSIVWPPSMNTWSVTAANIIASTSASRAGLGERGLERALGRVARAGVDEAAVPAVEPVDRHVVRSAAGRPGSAAPGCRCRSRRTRGRARARARGRRRRGAGSRFAIATSTVRPAPQPAPRYVVPKSTPVRTMSAAGTPASSRPSTDFAIDERDVSSRPLRSRACR